MWLGVREFKALMALLSDVIDSAPKRYTLGEEEAVFKLANELFEALEDLDDTRRYD